MTPSALDFAVTYPGLISPEVATEFESLSIADKIAAVDAAKIIGLRCRGSGRNPELSAVVFLRIKPWRLKDEH